ncbi:MAG: hypothetical protein IJ769_07350 [Clostridia bacterium]|nr:hypothetical protein [Clostridia bacterium]
MKKLLSLMLVCALCALALSGCKKSSPEPSDSDAPSDVQSAPGTTETPEEGYHGEEDQSAALAEMPTLEPAVPVDGDDAPADAYNDYYSIDALLGNDADAAPANAPAEPAADGDAAIPTVRPAVDTSAYQYSALTDTSLGFTFNYPSHWENVPGVYTVCFREKVEDGDFPARVAITAKTLVHSPDEEVITEELTDYLRMVHKQYDAATFQAGTPNTEERFLDKPALSNTYLAYSGENEVKGYIIGTAVGRTMYVFHFCATYEDYGAMESMMRYMVKSAEIVER